jgi:hypothetical protein
MRNLARMNHDEVAFDPKLNTKAELENQYLD